MRKIASGVVALVVLLAGALLWVSQMGPTEDLGFENPRARLTPGSGPMAGYVTIRNYSDREVALIGARSAEFGQVMLHRSVMRDGQARMEHQDRVLIAPRSAVEFRPGDLHLMLMRRQQELTVGDPVEIVFEFEGIEPSEWTVGFTVVPVTAQ